MRKTRVTDLVTNDDLPPAKQAQQFVTFYVNHRDLKLAACQAALDPDMGEKLYRNPKIRASIDAKLLLIDVENAKLKAKADRLTVDRVDAALMEEVGRRDSRKWSLRLAYERKGLIRDGEFYVAPNASDKSNAPSMYRAQQTTLRHTVTTEVIHAEAQASQQHDPIFAVKEY